jgi:hypothetical protein
MGFLDRIKRFIFFTALGWLFTKFQDQLPKLLGIVKVIGGIYNVAENIFKFLLETFVNFIDRGYKIYDKTREIVKGIGGEKAEKEFDNLSGKLNEYINYVLIGGMALTGAIKGFNSQSKKVAEKVTANATKAAARTTEGVAARTAGKVASGTVEKVGGKIAVRQLLRVAKGPLTKFPVVGGLIEFGLSAALGDPLGKAAFRGVGTVLLGAVGSLILPGFGTFALGWVGAELAAKLYEVLFENKKPTGPKKPIQKKASGGPVTRGGVSINRPIGRTSGTQQRKRKKLIPQPTKPGKNVGGEKKIKKLYQNPDDILSVTDWMNATDAAGDPLAGDAQSYKKEKEKNRGKRPNPYKALTNTAKILKEGGEAGILMAAGVDLAMGQDLGNNFSNSFSKDTLLKSKVNEVIQNIKKELSKKVMGGGNGSPTEMPGSGGGVGDTTNAGKVFNAFIAEGFTANQAAGVVGNLMQESGGGTKNLDPTAHNEVRNGHYGIAQWDKIDRWPAVSAYIRSIGKDPNSIDGQIAGLIWELKAKEKKAYAALKKATSAEQSAIVWLKEFERSGEVAGQSGFDNRVLNASRISKEFATTGTVGSVDNKNPILSTLGTTQNLQYAGKGRCTYAVIMTMEKNKIITPYSVTGADRDPQSHPRGLIIGMIKKYGWVSLPGVGIPFVLKSSLGETANVNVMTYSQYVSAVNSNKVPSGALVFQTMHKDWNANPGSSSGFDSAIARNGGKNLFNGKSRGDAIYGSVKQVIVLVPKGSVSGSTNTQQPTTSKPGQPPEPPKPGQPSKPRKPPSLTPQDKITIQQGSRTFSQLSEQSNNNQPQPEPNWWQRLFGLGGNKPQPIRPIPPPRKFLGFDGKMYTANFGTNEITDEKGNVIKVSNKKYTRIIEDFKNAEQGRRNMGLQGGGLIEGPNRRNYSSLSSYPSYDSGGGIMLAIQPIIIEKPVPVSSGGNKTIMFPVLVGVNNSNMASLNRG